MKRTQSLLFSLGVLIFLPGIAHGQAWSGILDPTRAIDWSTAGVPGGIPARNVICVTLGTPGQAASFVQSTTVAQINSALSSCPNSQVVLLNPGTYNTAGGNITIPSNVTLRGSGPTETIINTTGSSSGAIVSFGNGGGPNAGMNTSITGGTSKGSKSITVANSSGISVGMLMTLSQSDLSYMSESGDNGLCGWCNGGIGGDSGQTVQVTSVSGTTIGISDALYIGYTNSPVAFPYNAGCTSAGLEDLKISAQNVGYNPNINMIAARNSWVKNVESDFAAGAHMHVDWSLHNTIRDSFFHDGYSHGPGTEDDQLRISYKTSAVLVENNIFWRTHTSLILEWGASGNVVAYNYSTGNYDNNSGWLLEDMSFNHGAHSLMNLYEGNISTHFQIDSTWGTESHATLFRTLSTGSNKTIPPANVRGALQNGAATQQTGNTEAYSMDWTSQYSNMVGVIAGSDYAINSAGYASIAKAPASGGGGPTCVVVGYQSGSGSSQSPNNTNSTMLYQGVYNCSSGTFQWDNGVQALPASFYLSAKPSWWGTGAWPPIGPDVTGGNFSDWENPTATSLRGHVNTIPAITCFNTATSNGTTNTGAFDANTCYRVTSTSIAPPTNLSVIVH